MLYKHERMLGPDFGIAAKGGYTVAVQELEPWFFASLKPGDFFTKKLGVANCHPDDVFCKATGRQVAEKLATSKKFTVTKIVDTVGKREITFDVEGFGELVMLKVELAQSVRLA